MLLSAFMPPSECIRLPIRLHHEDLKCSVPPTFGARFWIPHLSTSDMPGKSRVSEGNICKIQSRSITVFVSKPGPASPMPSA